MNDTQLMSVAQLVNHKAELDRSIRQLAIGSEEFRQVFRQFGEAAKLLRQATKPLISGHIETWAANDELKRLKLPRRKKKAFIKAHGRQRYRSEYGSPRIQLKFYSAGGMI